ncbi:MAG: BBE domain-containing protein, partial [Hyphomicrobiales bacterium]|nr:BBE domain-containing protein [Hyphomicrobiales bacterium]MBV8661508.1 BBE domain-containing protein [Hyphomicrobiales bacterium]
SVVTGGPIVWELKDASTVMRWYREFQASAPPEEFCVFLGLQGIPASEPFPREHWGKAVCLLLPVHNGTAAEGERAVNALRGALPPPIIDWIGPMPYPALQSLFDGLLTKGLQWYWKGDFVKTLPDAAIDAHIAAAAKLPGPLSLMHLYPIDGAVHRRAPDATAWACRDAMWSMVIAGIDPDPQQAPALQRWTREYWQAVHPFDLAGAYTNFMMDDEGDARVKASYGENYPRLAALKRKFDPDNLFHVNQNIPPAA